jgi:hypothetical protein
MSLHYPVAVCGIAAPATHLPIEWRARYGGMLVTAYRDDRALAAIAGPWSGGEYSLIWWDRCLPAQPPEIFESLAAAKHRVEHWAGCASEAPALADLRAVNDPLRSAARASREWTAWMARVRELPAKLAQERPLPARGHRPLSEAELGRLPSISATE